MKWLFKLGLVLLAFQFNMCDTANPINDELVEDDVEEHHTPETLITTLQFNETTSGQVEAARLGQRFPASDFHVTGLYLPVGGEVTINLEYQQAGSGEPKLLIGTYSRYSDKWDPTQIDLHEGEQTVNGEQGGLLYIRYHSKENTDPIGLVEITFDGEIAKAPHYIHGETSNEEWGELLSENKTTPDVILESQHGIVVSSYDHAIQFRNEDQEELLNILDRVLQAEFQISGLDGSYPAHQVNTHKILLTESDTEDFFMAATWYRTFYHSDVVNHILTVDGLGNDGWGPWHEIGHMHQQDAWTWDTLGEVTVNIYSLAAEREMGISESRLVRDNVWPDVAAYMTLPDDERDFNSSLSGNWIRLAMFQQLWLAYGDEFYQNLHKVTREEQPDFDSRFDRMRFFMLRASEIAGRDLSEFFRKWGFLVDEAVYTEIEALGLPLPVKDPSTLTDDPDFEFSEGNPLFVVNYSSQEVSGEGGSNGRADRVVDGINGTYWHSRWSEDPAEYPHFLTLEINDLTTIQGVSFVQRNGLRKVKDIEILVKKVNGDWISMGHHELDENISPQQVEFSESVEIRQIKVVMNSSHDGNIYAALDEITLIMNE